MRTEPTPRAVSSAPSTDARSPRKASRALPRVGVPGIAIVGPMATQGFEGRLERMVEGTFSRLFRSSVKPVEFGRKLQREMDSRRSVAVDGRTIVPNWYRFTVSVEDYEQFVDIEGTLRRELADAAREHARDEGYSFVGPVDIELGADERLRTGVLDVESRWVEGEGGLPPGALILPTGDRVPLGEYVVSVGRQADCTIVLADPNVSRVHAEVRPAGDGFVVADLGSTNGTKVNGVRVAEHELQDGDEVRFGNTAVRFEAS